MVLATLHASAEAIEVRLEQDAVDIRTNGAPLASVLERIKQATGVDLVFEGPPPRQLIRAQLRRPTIAMAIMDLMQGQNLSYAMQLDETGRKPLKLIVFTNVSRAAPSSSRPARSQRAMPEPDFEEPPEMELTEGEPPLEPPPPEGVAGAEPPDPQDLNPDEAQDIPRPAGPMSPFSVVPLAPTPDSKNEPTG